MVEMKSYKFALRTIDKVVGKYYENDKIKIKNEIITNKLKMENGKWKVESDYPTLSTFNFQLSTFN